MRVDAAVRQAETSRSAFIHDAIENELRRQQVAKVKEEIAMLEINQTILAEGESVPVADDEFSPGDSARVVRCEMCQKILPSPPPVDGPLFCESCLSIAKGGRFCTARYLAFKSRSRFLPCALPTFRPGRGSRPDPSGGGYQGILRYLEKSGSRLAFQDSRPSLPSSVP